MWCLIRFYCYYIGAVTRFRIFCFLYKTDDKRENGFPFRFFVFVAVTATILGVVIFVLGFLFSVCFVFSSRYEFSEDRVFFSFFVLGFAFVFVFIVALGRVDSFLYASLYPLVISQSNRMLVWFNSVEMVAHLCMRLMCRVANHHDYSVHV